MPEIKDLLDHSLYGHAPVHGDLNQCQSVGVYFWNPVTSNIPRQNSYGAILVICSNGYVHDNSTNWIWQIGFETGTDTIYLRKKVNEGSWVNWRSI